MNIPYTPLAKIESDVIKNSTLPTAIKIAQALKVTIDELIK